MKDAAYRSPDERLAEKKSKYTPKSIFLNGVLYENPALRLVLGTCPLLAVTISAKSSLYMGLAVLFVLTASEAIISLLRNVIPNKVRIPAFITIIAVDIAERRLNMAKGAGATDIVNSRDPDAYDQVRALTDGKGVDCAYDATGDRKSVV